MSGPEAKAQVRTMSGISTAMPLRGDDLGSHIQTSSWLVIFGLVAPGLAWAYLDHRVWPWDQAQYAEITLKILGAFSQGIAAGVEAMGTSIDFKAPGLPWLGVPYALVGRLFERPEPALLCATLTWQLGTLLASYWNAYLVSRSRLIAAALTVFIGSTPLFVGLNHQYLVEPLQTFAVALSFLLALRARELSGEALFIALCALSALAMAAKASSPLYCVLPLLYSAYLLLSRRSFTPLRANPLIRLGLLTSGLLAVAAVGWWYVSHFSATFRNVRESTVGSLALNYGQPGNFANKLWYWDSRLGTALLSSNGLLVVAAAVGAAIGLFLQRRGAVAYGRHSPFRQGSAITFVVAAAAAHLVASLVVYALQINDDPRFLEPLLPAIVVVCAWLCRRSSLAVCTTLLATGVAQFVLVYPYALGWWQAVGVGHEWLRVAQRDDSSRRQMQTLVELTCDPDRPFDKHIVGVDYPWLSQYSANFYAAVAYGGRPACRYAAVGYAPTDLYAATKALDEVQHKYFIGVLSNKVPVSPEYEFLNRVSEPLLAHVAQSDDWEHVHTIQDTVVVFRFKRYDGLSFVRGTPAPMVRPSPTYGDSRQ